MDPKQMSRQEYNLAGLFMLYRGASMLSDWLTTYETKNDLNDQSKSECSRIFMSGNTSCTRNFLVALKFAFMSTHIDK